MLTVTISFFCGFGLAMFIFAILSANRTNCDDYTQMLEQALAESRSSHEAEVERIRKYHYIIANGHRNTISKLRERNALLELELIDKTGKTQHGTELKKMTATNS